MIKTISLALTEFNTTQTGPSNNQCTGKEQSTINEGNGNQVKDKIRNKTPAIPIFLRHLIHLIKSASPKKHEQFVTLIGGQRDPSAFLEDIQMQISSLLNETSDIDATIQLAQYHSAVHLLRLVLMKRYPIYRIVREWVMVNFDCGDNEYVRAMRGFFKNLGENENLEAIESGYHKELFRQLAEIKVRESKRSSMANIFRGTLAVIRNAIGRVADISANLFVNIFDKQLPVTSPYPTNSASHTNPNNIYTRYIPVSFPDILCYRTLYGRSLVKTRNELNYVLETMDIPRQKQLYADILLGRYADVLKSSILRADPVLRLLLLLCVKNKHGDAHSTLLKETFEQVGLLLLDTDWQLALDYLLFSGKINYYFNLVMRKIVLDSDSFAKLYSFGKTHFLENKIVEFYAQTLLSKGMFNALVDHVLEYDVMMVNARFVEFCYERVCSCLDDRRIERVGKSKTMGVKNKRSYKGEKVFEGEKIIGEKNILKENIYKENKKNYNEDRGNLEKNKDEPNFLHIHICSKSQNSDFLLFLKILDKIRKNDFLNPNEINFFFSITKYDIFIYHKELLVYLKDKDLAEEEALIAFTMSVKYKMGELNQVFNEKIRANVSGLSKDKGLSRG